MKKKLFFVCALFALLAMALPALGERVELLDGRITVELPEGIDFAVRGSVTEEQARKFPVTIYGQDLESYMEKRDYQIYGRRDDSLIEFWVSIEDSGTSDGFVGNDLADLVEAAKEYGELGIEESKARIYVHPQMPFMVFDNLLKDASGSFSGLFSRNYNTMYEGYFVEVGCRAGMAEWEDDVDAILSSIVDNISFSGLPYYHTYYVAENEANGEQQLSCGVNLTLPKGWMKLSADKRETSSIDTFVSNGVWLIAEAIDMYGYYAMGSSPCDRSEIYLGSELYSFEEAQVLFDAMNAAFNSDAAAESLAALISLQTPPDAVFFPEVVEEETQLRSERVEINGTTFYHIQKRFLGTIDNDMVICRKMPYAVDIYMTVKDARLYSFIGNVYFRDADTSGIPEIMQSVTFDQ